MWRRKSRSIGYREDRGSLYGFFGVHMGASAMTSGSGARDTRGTSRSGRNKKGAAVAPWLLRAACCRLPASLPLRTLLLQPAESASVGGVLRDSRRPEDRVRGERWRSRDL